MERPIREGVFCTWKEKQRQTGSCGKPAGQHGQSHRNKEVKLINGETSDRRMDQIRD